MLPDGTFSIADQVVQPEHSVGKVSHSATQLLDTAGEVILSRFIVRYISTITLLTVNYDTMTALDSMVPL